MTVKAAENYAKHGVSFETAALAFRDVFGIEKLDDRVHYGEERFILIGVVEGTIFTVVYTERSDRIRIVSARRATRQEKDEYFVEND